MSILKEFKEFAVKGNVIDLAVGVIIGGAFGKIVSSLVSDIIMPVLGLIISGLDFKNLGWVLKTSADGKPLIVLAYGIFLQNVVDFLIIALSVFLFVKLITTVRNKLSKEKLASPPAAPPEEIALLKEIRDALRQK